HPRGPHRRRLHAARPPARSFLRARQRGLPGRPRRVAPPIRYTPEVMLFRAGWVVPVDRPPLRDAAVAVEDGRVRWIGPAAEAPPGERRDLGPGVLLPGLVNAHCHLELSHLAGRLGEAEGFVDWVERLVTTRPPDPPETVRGRASAGIQELEDTGTAAVGDVSNALAHLDLLE